MTRETLQALRAESLTLAYDGRVVIDGLDLEIPDGRITAIVGPNASGKSTLLRGLARLMRPEAGRVTLDGRDVRAFAPREFARRVAVLPQQPVAPDGVLVADLVAQHALAGVAVPVGIVTGLIGAPYLLWLIARGDRKGIDG